ncbi:MAG: PKD domain-containing protein [Bacteroidales bacterium]|nr:PKD domain-containing protein [Bacteroidales bacterium]
MKKISLLFSLMLFAFFGLQAQQYNYSDSWGNAGFNLVASETSAIEVVYSVPVFALEDQTINGEAMKNIMLPGNFLFNDAGAPNLPGTGRYIAIPQGSVPTVRIVSQRTEVIHNVNIQPAPVIPADNDNNPLDFTKNMEIYGKDALYPASPVTISEVTQIRGTDAVILGVTPFQYNPVTKDLIVYRDIQIAIDCEGGTGVYGNDRLRSPYWDGLMSDAILNYSVLPAIDYSARINEKLQNPTEDDECEYMIITPTGDDFISWADSIAKFRNEQGILTKVFTVDEVGGNTTTAIEGFINNAYNTWSTPPAACLILGDYGTNGAINVIAPIWNNYCASDNIYADVNSDQMPDVILARMTANNDAQLTTFITKFLSYERNPETDTAFYNHPITALGWQTERWFQICSEVVGGYFLHVKGRQPTRINALYGGNPNVDPWSTATNTSTVLNYFGPNGLGYIPATPQELGGFTGGTSTQVTNAINAGSFVLQHRDHGAETLWGEPSYSNNNINQLDNTQLIHIFSINCLTGKYNWGSECFTEKFHRHTKNGYNSGALSVTGASEVSYSFVNDTYVWGLMDNLWPDFMPAMTSQVEHRGLLPAFGNAAGKYFLQQSSWPYNTNNKSVTYNLFHHHGDAFSCLYDTVPAELDVDHDTIIMYGSTTFPVTATEFSIIALSLNGELLATAEGEGSTPVVMTIPVLPPGSQVKVVVTMKDYFRYEDLVPVVADILIANFEASATHVCDGNLINFTDLSSGNPTAWEWTFEGGTPSSSTEQHPGNIEYTEAGSYTVSLTVTKGTETSTETKTDFINVFHTPTADFEAGPLCEKTSVNFTDLSNPNGGTITAWAWDFGDPASGINNNSTLQNPSHIYVDPGTYIVTLYVVNDGTCIDSLKMETIIEGLPQQAAAPQGDAIICEASTGNLFTTDGTPLATSYEWILDPSSAGTIIGTGTEITLDVAEGYTGSATLRVRGINDCGNGSVSDALTLTVQEILPAPAAAPAGPDTVDLKEVTSSDFTATEVTGAIGYTWVIDPENAGELTPDGLQLTVTWDPDFRGDANITYAGVSDECEGYFSPAKVVTVKNTLGINEFNAYNVSIYPNPNTGKFNIKLNTGEQSVVNIKIFNLLGTMVYHEENVSIFNDLTKTIDLSSIPKGIYHLKVEGTRGTSILRVVIDR